MDRDERARTQGGKAKEDEFFARQSAKLKDKLRAQLEREQGRTDLVAAYPNLTGPLVERFLDLGLDVEGVAALGLLPLVMVAWADGNVEAKERAAILSAAEQRGLGTGTKAQALLADWLAQRPSPHVIESWQHFVTAACAGLSTEERAQLSSGVLRLAEDVARAAGGFMGVGSKISKDEQAVLDRITRTFAGG